MWTHSVESEVFFTYFQKCLEVSCVSFPFFPCFSLTWKVIVVIHHGLNMPKLCPLPALGEMYKRDVQVGHKEDALCTLPLGVLLLEDFPSYFSQMTISKCNRTIKSWVRSPSMCRFHSMERTKDFRLRPRCQCLDGSAWRSQRTVGRFGSHPGSFEMQPASSETRVKMANNGSVN